MNLKNKKKVLACLKISLCYYLLINRTMKYCYFDCSMSLDLGIRSRFYVCCNKLFNETQVGK